MGEDWRLGKCIRTMKLFIVFVSVIACTGQTNHMRSNENPNENLGELLTINSEMLSYDSSGSKARSKRGIFWDFFQKMVITKNLIVDQYADTRDTLNEVYNLINDQFSDPAAEKPRRPTTTTDSSKSSNEETTESSETTTEAYRISRYELGRILGRNFRGLKRLQEIEFQDALNQSHYNIQEYKAEATKQFANSLAVEKKKKLQALKG